MTDLLPLLVVLALGGLLASALGRGLDREERQLIWLAYGVHVAAMFAQRYVSYSVYGVSDMMVYFASGRQLSTAMGMDFARFAPAVASILVHVPPDIPFAAFGAGSSTGSLTAITGVLLFVLGDSEYAAALALTMASFAGKVALYRAVRPHVVTHKRRAALVIATMVPSVVFWSAGIVKEAVVFAGLGWLVLGLRRFIEERRGTGALLAFAGASVVSLTKAYVLFPAIIGAGIWFALDRVPGARERVRVRHLLVGAALAVLGVTLLGYLFPRFALETLADEAAHLQALGERARGGSYFEASAGAERSLVGQLVYSPVAILTALFRPFVFEVRNAPMLLSAVETLAVTLFVATLFVKRRARQVFALVMARPFLVFATVFTFLLALGVGLTSTNLGTLSRYRTPLIPMFLLLVLVLQTTPAPVRVTSSGAQPARGLGVRP